MPDDPFEPPPTHVHKTKLTCFVVKLFTSAQMLYYIQKIHHRDLLLMKLKYHLLAFSHTFPKVLELDHLQNNLHFHVMSIYSSRLKRFNARRINILTRGSGEASSLALN
jgi:hypothetical protein